MFVLIAGVLAIIGTMAAGYYFAMRPVTLRIAVGPPNSDDVKLVQTLAQAFNNQANSQVKLRPMQTDGAPASAQVLAEGKADLAIIRGDLEVPKNAQAVATLRKNVVVMWVPPAAKGKRRKGPKITKIAQLAGHKIGVVGRTQANVNLLKMILVQYGIDPMKVDIVQFPVNEAVEAIRNQKADAYLAAGPANSKITIDAIAASAHDGNEPTFLAIDASEAIAQNHPAYEASEIPAGSLGSADRPEDEVKTISFSHHIVARKGLSESTVAAFTRQLFSIRQSLKSDFPLAAKIETPDTDKDAVIPVHPGAAAFVDGEEKTFLDRYSDYIWWSLMALSAMGSAGAWFAGYLKQDERNTNTSQRDRLLDMLKAARRSDSTDELDQMQAEADDILRDTLVCFERGAIEQGTLTAFNIALEQFHNAVADRKALLMSMPQNLQRAATQFRAAGSA
ncbi:TAXI family TRAP transporter solute-binding subunit [Bradyrhizobium sp. ISRA443]|uniref:TAXI family TRAP transporter solute-binding subunit n=1 Tax=unclassified Bradyrhizobium TaxID=2631580 RepID=UPI00247A8721|nr:MULTISPECIES: TAXI family TRAP transporter solute-binding subunit [unclassified Bradyrhizobium]WGS02926.1 TAXI family TRAP transporter solute-binding subunit [Bradyrhizobium sp. ISRA436]WGS09812.1 TAXI family TRAP transporter solute-binding subunit [Bradyrhizobium sp. ISRA437]WGS16697.1 TAXI family TRAP transporter solute-binding subunit [Bradyrhizobium sp. ISRA443]